MPEQAIRTHRRTPILALCLGASLALLLTATPTLFAGTGSLPQSSEVTAAVPLADVHAGIARALDNHRYDDIFDWIEADVEGRAVVLRGAVYMPWKRDSVEKRVAAVAGVGEVINEIEVLPVSGFDDRIRYQVARAIYGSHSFFDRAGWNSPPIHIIVSKGRITLEGVVNNEAERMLARSLASRSPNSIGRIENNLRLESEIAR